MSDSGSTWLSAVVLALSCAYLLTHDTFLNTPNNFKDTARSCLKTPIGLPGLVDHNANSLMNVPRVNKHRFPPPPKQTFKSGILSTLFQQIYLTYFVQKVV